MNGTAMERRRAAPAEQALKDAEKAVHQHGVVGFHFHPIMGHFSVDDPKLNPLFETISGLGVPVMVDVGTTGMGAGMPGGMGALIEHAHPLALDRLAARFPDLTIIAAHPGWPWIDEMTAVALHKGNVYWEMSGWAPKYFPPQLRTDIRGRLRDKVMFGSDYPSMPYERILREWDELGPLIEKHRVTHIHVVPALLIKWLNDPDIDKYDLSSVRVIQSGGQRLQPETRLLAEKLLPNCTVQENFGMAEGLLMFVRLDDPREVRLETVGRPICADDEVRLVDEDGKPVADGEIGELLCRGPYTLRGYFRAPEHNARAFTADGFYRSGDLMWRHPTGNYVVAGRSKDLINRGGEKISADEVENLILAHPAVQNVACIPVPDPVLGERMCACIVPHPGTEPPTLDDLVAFLRSYEIAAFKLPERLEVLDAFPLSPIGKVSKKDLVARFAEEPRP
jgi:hypothetical protein